MDLPDNQLKQNAESVEEMLPKHRVVPWHRDARFWTFVAVIGVLQLLLLVVFANAKVNEYGYSTEALVTLLFFYPLFLTLMPVLMGAVLRRPLQTVLLTLLNVAFAVPPFLMPLGLGLGLCAPYTLPLVAFGLSACLTAHISRRHAKGLCPVPQVMLSFLLVTFCFYAWIVFYANVLYEEADIVGGALALGVAMYLLHPAYSVLSQFIFSYSTGRMTLTWFTSAFSLLSYSLLYLFVDNPTFDDMPFYMLGVFVAGVASGFLACIVKRRKGRMEK